MKYQKHLFRTPILNLRRSALSAFALACAASPAIGATLSVDIPDATAKKGALTLRNSNGTIAEFKASASAQFQYVCADSGNGRSRNGFSIRRTDISLAAKIDDSLHGAVAFEFDGKTDGGLSDNGYIEYAYAGYTTAAGTFRAGLLKPHFLQEEITPFLKLPAIERSVVSNYLASASADVRGLASSHIGVFWDGKLHPEETLPLNYGLSLTNAVTQDYDARSDALSVTGYAETELLFSEAKWTFGISAVANFGNDGFEPGIPGGPVTNAGTVYGIEPYVKISAAGLNILLDGYYVNGDEASRVSRTLAGIALASYRLENGFEPVLRFTRFNTKTLNGGIHAGYANNVPATKKHSNAATYYVGANYHVNEHVKISAGYEYGRFFGTSASESSNTFRTQLQISF